MLAVLDHTCICTHQSNEVLVTKYLVTKNTTIKAILHSGYLMLGVKPILLLHPEPSPGNEIFRPHLRVGRSYEKLLTIDHPDSQVCFHPVYNEHTLDDTCGKTGYGSGELDSILFC